MTSPAQTVKARFGDKTKLVDALKPFLGNDLWVSRENADKGLSRVSNGKLLRLYETFSAVQSKWGSRSKLIDAILDLEGRQKDTGFKSVIESWPVPRLYDRWKSAARRAHVSGAPATAPKPHAEGGEAPAKAAKPAKPPAAAKSSSKAPAKKAAASSAKSAGKKPTKKSGK